MPRPWDEIVYLTQQMMRERGAILQKMRDVQARYEGDYVIAMPDVDTEPRMPPLTPSLIGEAIDKSAQRAASVEPMLGCPALDSSKDRGRGSLAYASTRRRALQAGYHQSKWPLGRRKAYRQLSAYYTCSLVVLPDFRNEIPRLEVRDPLGTFAETVSENELRAPCYVAYITRHSSKYLRYRFEGARKENGGPIPGGREDDLWDMVEWIDEDQTVFGILGPASMTTVLGDTHVPHRQISPVFPNRLGMVPAAIPGNVSLNRISSRLSNLIGNIDWQAKLMSLSILAQEKAIFPDMYAIGDRGMTPAIVGGRWQDGREGHINLLEGVTQVGVLRNTPDVHTDQTIDRLERNFRVSTGLIPQYGGESFGSLRTGRALDTMMGISIDPAIQELHEVMQAWMPHMNAAMLQTWKQYWGSKSFSLQTGRPGDEELVTFTPDDHFETLANTVSYPIPGADAVQQTQILGSLLGTKAISRRTFRKMHPWIADPEREGHLVDEEEFEAALAQAMLQQLMSGQLPLPVATLMHKYLRKGFDIFEATEKADKEIRELQAQAAPPPGEGQIMAPEQAPGLAGGPGQLQQQPMPDPAAGIAVPEGAERMRALMQAMGAS